MHFWHSRREIYGKRMYSIVKYACLRSGHIRPPINHVLWAFMLCHDDNVCFGLDDESKVKMVEVFIGIYGFYKQ